ncbi:MAG: ATPase domain-containing protein [Polyangiaceae bacterium]
MRPREKLATRVPGLDVILHGGLEACAVYMIEGRPGAGKTVLANHIAYLHAANGGRVLYVTLLAETHERMVFNLEQFAFFEAAALTDRFAYVSGFSALEENGLTALTDLVRRETRARRATLLVVDGLVAIEETAETARNFKKFIHEVQVIASLLGCTVLLLSTSTGENLSPVHTMVDGILEVVQHRFGRRAEREIEVKKLRGSIYLRGSHPFEINDTGLTVLPRLESQYGDPPSDSPERHRVSTGVATLDEMLHGGIASASTTVVFGPSGAGKTVLGLHFLDASTEAEPGLHFGFYETPQQLLHKASKLGLDLEAKQKKGVFHTIWQPPTERVLDILGHRLLSAVRERGVKRLVVDGLDPFVQATNDGDRITPFFSALTNQLRLSGVTALYTFELRQLVGKEVTIPIQGVSALTENMILLRFVEHGAELLRLISVVKTRDSANDSTLRELQITSAGIRLGPPLRSNLRDGPSTGTTQRILDRILQGRGPSP